KRSAGAFSACAAMYVMAVSSSAGSTSAVMRLSSPAASTRSSHSRRSRHCTAGWLEPRAAACERVNDRSSMLRRPQAHLLQHGTAEQAVRIAELLHHLEVVVALHDREADRLARRFNGGGEVAALALEFWRLGSAIDERDRRAQLVEVALGGELLLHLV